MLWSRLKAIKAGLRGSLRSDRRTRTTRGLSPTKQIHEQYR
jgi:hypothetical protein